MTEHPYDPGSAHVESSGGQNLPSARDQAAPNERPKKRKGARGRPAKPTPVRVHSDAGAPAPAVQPDLAEALIEAQGRSWTVRVLGRSGGGGVGGAPPLLLVGFWEQGSRDLDHAREALVVGRTLAGLSMSHLDEAFARAVPPRGEG